MRSDVTDDGDLIIGFREYLNILATSIVLSKEFMGKHVPDVDKERILILENGEEHLYEEYVRREYQVYRSVRDHVCSVLL